MTGHTALYEELGVAPTANAEQIRRAYLKRALKLHPDRNKAEGAKEEFQELQKVYEVLSDEEKRKIYDQTGDIEATELTGEQFDDLYEHYRGMFKKVETDDIEEFTEKYKHSEEEESSLLELYERFRGDMKMVFSWQMCSDQELDSHRFRDIIKKAIEEGNVKSFKKFRSWAAKVDSMPPPNKSKTKKKKKEDRVSGDLLAQIQANQKGRAESLFSSLAAKYGGGAAMDFEEPSEEAFQQAQARVQSRTRVTKTINKNKKKKLSKCG